MINYNKEKYNLEDELYTDKILLLKDKITDKKVIAKLSQNNKKEYENLQALQSLDSISKVISYEDDILYFEYIANTLTLKELIKKNQEIPFELFYEITLKLFTIIYKVHSLGFIHKDINTNNILYNEQTKELYLIDFELSSSIKEKIDINQNIDDLKGHIHFISPEQTGRVNRAVDFRSDFYSLGIVLYNLLTSRVPFEADDFIGVVHQHISKKPNSLNTLNPKIPNILSNLVLKLLEKEPEDRYQSINGIVDDLESIQKGKTKFELGSKDFNDKLVLKHAHYGRIELIEQIREIFKSTINNQSRLVTIGGFSGTGKSSVVYELHKTLSINFGFYGESKFDQLNASAPYYGFTKIFDEYFTTILKQEKERVENFKDSLLELLGDEAYILTTKIASLEQLVGKQTELETLSAKEEEIRFYRVFLSLVKYITNLDKPLIFFIDDLQWADSGTIDLIKKIVEDETINNLLIINAYRDNEVDNNHSYIKMLKSLSEDTPVDEFIIQNLQKVSVEEIVKETIYKDDDELVNFIYKTSAGNPFFITQMINLFNNEKFFKFDRIEECFIYDMHNLYSMGLSSDVIEIATKNIKTLDDETINILKLASAIGNKFNLFILNLTDKNENIENKLNLAREKYFIIKVKNYYKFSHDKIQQAFYTLIDDDTKRQYHKNIAQSFDKNKDNIDFFTNIDLEIATHYNKALAILDQKQKQQLVTLNLKVAKSIKKVLAYDEAIKYLDAGLNILDKNDKELYWDYTFLKMEILHNTFKVQEMPEFIDILERLINSDEKAVYLAKYVLSRNIMLGHYVEAINYGVKTMKRLGINIPSKGSIFTVIKEFIKFKYKLRGKKYIDILDLRENKNKKMVLINALMYDIQAPAHVTDANLYLTYGLISSNLSLKYGNSKYSAYSYSTLALMLGGVYLQFKQSEELGELSVKLAEKIPDTGTAARVNLCYGDFIIHGTKPYAGYIEYKNAGDRGFIKTGGILDILYNEFFTSAQRIVFNTTTLNDIKQKNIDVYKLYFNANAQELIKFQVYILSFISRLQNGDKKIIEREYQYDKEKYIQEIINEPNRLIKAVFYTFISLELYIYDDFKKGFYFADQGSEFIKNLQGIMVNHIFRMVYCLLYLESEKPTISQRIQYIYNKFLLKRYAKYAPENFNTYYFLVEAQEANKKGNFKKAVKYFKDALSAAIESKILLHIALSQELAGKFWIQRDEKIGRMHLEDAYETYTKYKAFAKAEKLKNDYSLKVKTVDTANQTIKATNNVNLDMQTILKTTQTLSKKIKVDEILSEMSKIIVENIGANKGFLLLKQNDKLNIVASIDDEKIDISNRTVEDEEAISQTLLNYVVSTNEILMLEDGKKDTQYLDYTYKNKYNPKSMLVVPMIKNNKLRGILYCENSLLSGVFNQRTLDLVSVVLSQLIISLDNAFIYDNMDVLIKERTLELEKQKETFEAIYNSTTEAIGITDMTSKFIKVNPAYLKMTGFSKEEITQKTCIDLTHPDDLEYSMKKFESVFIDGYIKNFEKRCRIKDGSYINIIMSISLLKDPGRILLTVRDITKEKKMNSIILEERNKAIQATKSKSEFLANMSHEIRTPMNGIIGMTHILEKTTLDEKQKHYLKTINTSSSSLLSIINDILDFSKIEAGKLEIDKIDFSLKELINNVVNIIGFKATEKSLDFKINCHEMIPKNLNGDSLRISQILINLLNNAVKFTNSGFVKINISNTNDRFKFEVIDTGIGMTQTQQQKLFQSFSQADSSTTRDYGGTGLGLSISKQLVELMGGEIWVQSEKGVGSTFGFELRLEKAKNPISIDKKSKFLEEDIQTLQGSEILLVEDTLINQEIILGLLENSGIIIDLANNGKEGVELFSKNSYELILMDIQMPIMDGYEATKIIRASDSNIPIIALTGNAMKEDIGRTQAVGMNEHLNKPIDVEKFYETLLKYISKKVKNRDITLVDEKKDDITIPSFTNIDTKLGLSHMANNKKLYMKTLQSFYKNYQNLKLVDLSDKELQRVAHTIKGLSANIGSTSLSEIARQLEETLNKELLSSFYEELHKVLEEIKNVTAEDKEDDNFKTELSQKMRDEFFTKIKEFALKNRARQCKNIVEELKKYKLSQSDKQLLEEILKLLNTRKYKQIVEII
jgi:PAS domain S-box-containing protein